MAELIHTGRDRSGLQGHGLSPPMGHANSPSHAQQLTRPSTAGPRLQGASDAHRASREHPSARQMLAFLGAAEDAAARGGKQPSMFPSGSVPSNAPAAPEGPTAGPHPRPGSQTKRRPQSAAPQRSMGGPRLRQEQLQGPGPAQPPARRHGRVSLFDHQTAEREPHEVPGPKVLRDLAPPRMGFPARPPEGFMRAGEGLSLAQRNKLKGHLQRFPVNREAPFVPGTGGLRLSWEARPATAPPPSANGACPASLLRTYYDNGTLDFLAVRWRGNREDALAWARGVDRGPEGAPRQAARPYTVWGPEPPPELDVVAWLPVFLDGIREVEEPYRFLAVRGSEDMIGVAGDRLHIFADTLVAPLKAALDTRDPVVVAVALRLMLAALEADPRVAACWVQHYWQFAQVLNLFRGCRRLVVDMGYNSRQVQSIRDLATHFATSFELAGGPAATAAVRRYSPGFDPAVTAASQARAAERAAARAREAGRDPGAFVPFTLF